MIEVKDKTGQIEKKLIHAQKTGVIQINSLDLAVFPKQIQDIAELRFDAQKWWDIVPITKLDLSNNSIKEVPSEIANLKDLVSFRMQNNQLESLPETLFLIETLKSVDCTHNKIKRLPPTVTYSFSLVELTMKDNLLDLLPVSYEKLNHLEILDLSHNKLTKFPLHQGDLPNLKRLDISENLLESLDANIGTLEQLETLILNKNKIKAVPQGVFQGLQNLKLLDLKENKLTYFDEFPATEKLDSVFLSFNQITDIRGFENCPKLTVLDFKNNKVAKLDSSIGYLKELKTLDLSNNDLSDIPNEIGFMAKLVRMTIEGNPLKCIRSTIRNAGAEALKKFLRERADNTGTKSEIVKEFEKVQKIDVWDQFIKDFLVQGKELVVTNKKITEINNKFCQLNIVHLDLSQNLISEVNPNLISLSNLIKLKLNNNKIEFIPGDILIQLPFLEELELKGNKMKEFMSDVPNQYYHEIFLDLKHLDLSQNQFTELPEIIPYINKLRVLFIAYNKITSVDELFHEGMENLEILDASNNKIKTLSDKIITLQNLEHLNLEYNDISNIPTILGYLTSIKNLNLYGNPLKNIRNDVIAKGPKYVLEFLQSKHPVPYEAPPKKQAPKKMIVEEEPVEEIKNYKVTQINPHNLGQKRESMNIEPKQQQQQQYDPNSYKDQYIKERNMVMQQQQQKKVIDPKIQKEIEMLEITIGLLEKELRDNFTLSTNQINNKKREINILRSNKNKLIQQLNGEDS